MRVCTPLSREGGGALGEDIGGLVEECKQRYSDMGVRALNLGPRS
jgi:hypothetical protein